MKKQMCQILRTELPVTILLWVAGGICCPGAAPLSANSQTNSVDYEEPKILSGDIFAMDAEPKKLIFKFQRSATRSGTTVHVLREYTYPDGSPAARERCVYEAGQLASYEEEKLQTGEKGSAVIRPDPKKPGQRKIFFEYTTGQGGGAKTSSASENLGNETLVGDMVSAFIAAHWDALAKGSAARFRYIVPSRKETVGFKLVKESETTWQGKPVVRLRMEPTSFIIAQLVDPIFFVVEKNDPHRVLEYIGRTTPLMKSGNKWKDVDAVTIFDWK